MVFKYLSFDIFLDTLSFYHINNVFLHPIVNIGKYLNKLAQMLVVMLFQADKYKKVCGTMSDLSKEEKQQLKKWLSDSFQAIKHLDGSEVSEEKVYAPLSLFDDFVRAKIDGIPTINDEKEFVQAAYSEYPEDMPETVDGFLDSISDFYNSFKNASSPNEIWKTLQDSGAIIKDTDNVFVKTDNGQLHESKNKTPSKYAIKTEPRLAMLIAHLRNDGVNGTPVYMDDLVITKGKADPSIVRENPYNIVQIPRLNMEVAVCDQVGETTFVKAGTIGFEFWDHMSKDQLKERNDILHVDKNNKDQWWQDISGFLSGNAELSEKKINVKSWINKKPNLDIELIDESLLTHQRQTGDWLTASKVGRNGKKGGYVLEHGPYAGSLTVGNIDNVLRIDGLRGVRGKSSIAQRKAIISKRNSLDYKNYMDQDALDMNLIDESLLAHRQQTGDWLKPGEVGENGKIGSYVLEHGPYAGKLTASALENALKIDGSRGLTGKSSIAKRNAIVSEKYGLGFKNHMELDDFDIDLIDESLLAHRQQTGYWLKARAKGPDGKEGGYILEHGSYAGKISASELDRALIVSGARGLEGKSSIAKRNAIISKKHGLDFIEIEDLEINLIDESLLAHRQQTGDWLLKSKTDSNGKKGKYILEHGSYAGKITAGALEAALYSDGSRGLRGKSSIAQRNAIISEKYSLDYKSKLNQDDLDMDLIDESLLAHRQQTGRWLSASAKGSDGKDGTYTLEYGPYAGTTLKTLQGALQKDDSRGLKGKSSIAQRNAIISEKHGLDYVVKSWSKIDPPSTSLDDLSL